MIYSKHALKRIRQRSIPETVVNLILAYGEEFPAESDATEIRTRERDVDRRERDVDRMASQLELWDLNTPLQISVFYRISFPFLSYTKPRF